MGAPLIITGAPRTGQALVAQELAEAGLHFGDDLALRDGVAGLFADGHASRLLDAWLEEQGRGWADPPDPPPGDAVVASLPGLEGLAERYASRAAWGIKEPRAVLFADAWQRQLPEARWFFVVRAPDAAIWSLVKTDLLRPHARDPYRQGVKALKIWVHYNRLVSDFAGRNRDRCLILITPDAFGDGQQRYLEQVLGASWGMGLSRLAFAEAFRSHLWTKKAPGWVRALTSRARVQMESIRALADELWRDNGVSTRGSGASNGRVRLSAQPPDAPPIVLFSNKRSAYSQTFVHDQLRWLPARVHFAYGRGPDMRTGDGFPVPSKRERAAYAAALTFGVEKPRMGIQGMRRFLRRTGARLVLAEFGTAAVHVHRACAAEGVPLIVRFHGYDAFMSSVQALHAEEYPELFEVASAILAVSGAIERELVRLGAPAHKIHHHPCGVDTRFFREAARHVGPPLFLAVGRFVSKKAPVLSLLAFSETLKRAPEARLVMVGDGPALDSTKQLARAMDLDQKVQFRGAVPHVVVRGLMRQARAFVQHSVKLPNGDAEGTPVAVMEAAATGLPIVATRHSGIPDVVVHEKSGYLVEEGEVQRMAEFMVELARSPEAARRLGQVGRAHVAQRFALDVRVKELWSLCQTYL